MSGGDVVDILKHHVDPPLKIEDVLTPFNIRTVDPYSVNKVNFKLKVFDSLIESTPFFNDIMVFHDNYLQMPINLKGRFKDKYMRLKVIYCLHERILGHFLYGYTPVNKVESPLNIRCLDDNLCVDECDIKSVPSIMNIISVYSATPYARVIFVIKALQILRENPKVKALVVTVHYQEIFNFFDAMAGSKVLEKGSKIALGGVKVFGISYRYARIMVKAEDFLSAKELLTFVVHGNRYLKEIVD